MQELTPKRKREWSIEEVPNNGEGPRTPIAFAFRKAQRIIGHRAPTTDNESIPTEIPDTSDLKYSEVENHLAESGASCTASPSVDRFGFLIGASRDASKNIEEQAGPKITKEIEPQGSDDEVAIAAWKKHLDQWEVWKANPLRLCGLIKAGVPHKLRSSIWPRMIASVENIDLDVNNSHTRDTSTDSEAVSAAKLALACCVRDEQFRSSNSELASADEEPLFTRLAAMRSEHSDQIELDIPRTFPTHSLFKDEDSKGKVELRRVLNAFAVHRKDIGYCQGMSFVAAVLLMQEGLSSDTCFHLLRWMLAPSRLGPYYEPSMSGVIADAECFGRILNTQLLRLSQHFDCHGIHTLMYATPWFMTVMTSLPDWKSVLSCFDFFFLEGTYAIFRFGLAVMQLCEDTLLDLTGIDKILPMLQSLPVSLVSHTSLLRAAVGIPVECLVDIGRLAVPPPTPQPHRGASRASGPHNRSIGKSAIHAAQTLSLGSVSRPTDGSFLDKVWGVFTPIRSRVATAEQKRRVTAVRRSPRLQDKEKHDSEFRKVQSPRPVSPLAQPLTPTIKPNNNAENDKPTTPCFSPHAADHKERFSGKKRRISIASPLKFELDPPSEANSSSLAQTENLLMKLHEHPASPLSTKDPNEIEAFVSFSTPKKEKRKHGVKIVYTELREDAKMTPDHASPLPRHFLLSDDEQPKQSAGLDSPLSKFR